MALSGIQIYKLLPQTNCKDCGYPTCLAFAMKLAAKQADLAACPHVSVEAAAALAAAAQPPVRPLTVRSNGHRVEAGNETVLYRHEKRFFSPAGVFLRLVDSASPEAIQAEVARATAFEVDYVGIDLTLDGFVVQADGGDFLAAVQAVRAASHRPLILLGEAEALAQGLQALGENETPMVGMATAANWRSMATLAQEHKAILAVEADTVDAMVDLVHRVQEVGVKDIVLAPAQRGLNGALTANTLIRRMALKKDFRPLGFPILNFAGNGSDPDLEVIAAAQAIAKYGGFVVLDHFSPESAYPLLVLRQNVYTDPQKPIQVTPGIYEINSPTPDDPVLVTTNFSITYFSVANEVESSGHRAWLLVADAEGMSVLTAWAAGKFDAERIAKDVKRFDVAAKVGRRRLVLPGQVAVLSGELEEELPDWQVMVGPREAVDIPSYLKQVLS